MMKKADRVVRLNWVDSKQPRISSRSWGRTGAVCHILYSIFSSHLELISAGLSSHFKPDRPDAIIDFECSIYGTAMEKPVTSHVSRLVLVVETVKPTTPPPAGGVPVNVPTC
jgi:hypothetical protein